MLIQRKCLQSQYCRFESRLHTLIHTYTQQISASDKQTKNKNKYVHEKYQTQIQNVYLLLGKLYFYFWIEKIFLGAIRILVTKYPQ